MPTNPLKVQKILLITAILINLSHSAKQNQGAAKQVSEIVQEVQNHINSQNMCIEDFETKINIEEDREALDLYIQSACKSKKEQSTLSFIENFYGEEKGVLTDNSFLLSKLYFKDSAPERKWEALKQKRPDAFYVFSELNQSACIKKKIDEEYLTRFGLVQDCFLGRDSLPIFFLPRYKMSLENHIKNMYQEAFQDRGIKNKLHTLVLMQKIAVLIQQLHKNGFAHENLSPIRILLSEDMTPNLIGIGGPARIPVDLHQQMEFGLYMDYQLITKTRCSPSVHDIYSLGLIYYEMIYGKDGHTKLIHLLTSGSINAQVNNVSTYVPDTSILNIPSEFDWIYKMLSSATDAMDPRLGIDEVIGYLNDMVARYQEEERQSKNINQNVGQNLEVALDNICDQSSVRMTVDSVGTVETSRHERLPAYQAMLNQYNKKNNMGQANMNILDELYLNDKNPSTQSTNTRFSAAQETTGINKLSDTRRTQNKQQKDRNNNSSHQAARSGQLKNSQGNQSKLMRAVLLV